MSSRIWSTVLWHNQTFATILTHSPPAISIQRGRKSWTVLFSTWGRPVQRLSWTTSLSSRNALTHRASVRYGNAASSYVSCSPGKDSCVLRHRATSILIQERCSTFVNMVLVRSHYPYESQRSTHCGRLKMLLTLLLGFMALFNISGHQRRFLYWAWKVGQILLRGSNFGLRFFYVL